MLAVRTRQAQPARALFDIIAKNIILFYVQKNVYLVPYASYPGGTGDTDPPKAACGPGDILPA